MPGLEEDVGLIGIHHPGGFINLVPQVAHVEWEVAPWGSWRVRAVGQGYEALVEATAEEGAGTVLRAPTADRGLAPFCKVSFFGKCRLRVWEVDSAGVRRAQPMIDARSETAAVEVGGGR